MRRAAWRGLVIVAATLMLGSAPLQVSAQVVPGPTIIGWELFRKDKPVAAAEAWAQASAQSARRRTPAGLREAAFASVLATLAYEQAGDERAYARWADAVRLYLEAGFSWEREREELRNRWRSLERQLSQASAGVPPTLGPDEQMLADLVRRVSFTEYKGPRAGLKERRDEAGEISNITPQYFSGASRADSSNDVASPQSRYGTAGMSAPAESPASGGLQIAGRTVTSSPMTGPTLAQPAVPLVLAPTAAPSAAVRAAPAASNTAVVDPQMVRGRPAQPDVSLPITAGSALAQRDFGMPRRFEPSASRARTLTPADRITAQAAWRYVIANRQSNTGLVNGKDSYPVASVADIGQTIAAYVSALSLQFIEREGFEADMRQLLGTLRELPLYNRELFNRDYDSRSGRMLDLGARSSEVGSGWAAEDIGRLMFWLRVLANTSPDLAPAAETVVARLRLSRLVANGRLYSALNQDGREQIFADLRLGRQQLTAAALSLWGVVLPAMLGYDDAVTRRVGSVTAPGDRRDGGALSPEVFARGIVEFGGLDGCFEAAARGMLDAQHLLAARKGGPVMVADELLDRAPWFVYGSLAAAGEEWRVAGFDQQPQPTLANFSLKAAHLWSAVDVAAPTLAARGLADSFDRSERGLYGGRYLDGRLNLALTLDTNASVLLAAQHGQRGGKPVLRVENPVDHDCPGLRGTPK